MNTWSNYRYKFLDSRSRSFVVFFPPSPRDKKWGFHPWRLLRFWYDWTLSKFKLYSNCSSASLRMTYSNSDSSIFSSRTGMFYAIKNHRCQRKYLWNKNWECSILVYLFSQKAGFTSLVIICIMLLSRGLMHHK